MPDKDNDGWTALHVAAVLGHADVCRLLLEHHAEVFFFSGKSISRKLLAEFQPNAAGVDSISYDNSTNSVKFILV